ncbi:hypothetical protein HanRHA438_Chr11g0513191 [Helianthus annuus]|nr:hypothetical protein HanIR_Chr11g0538781 [Helianthus annuus]KAJ0871511.1 hypothetical protein HanRHA438_Chr11g0513191 [Helianthus annuus]
MMKTRSEGITPRCSFPFSGNVIFVPFFHPGLISIVRISSTVRKMEESVFMGKANPCAHLATYVMMH